MTLIAILKFCSCQCSVGTNVARPKSDALPSEARIALFFFTVSRSWLLQPFRSRVPLSIG